MIEGNPSYCAKGERLYQKHCITCKAEITKAHMKARGDITYCKLLSDGTNPEYTCSFVQCLKCALHDSIHEQTEQFGRKTRSRQARAV